MTFSKQLEEREALIASIAATIDLTEGVKPGARIQAPPEDLRCQLLAYLPILNNHLRAAHAGCLLAKAAIDPITKGLLVVGSSDQEAAWQVGRAWSFLCGIAAAEKMQSAS